MPVKRRKPGNKAIRLMPASFVCCGPGTRLCLVFLPSTHLHILGPLLSWALHLWTGVGLELDRGSLRRGGQDWPLVDAGHLFSGCQIIIAPAAKNSICISQKCCYY